MVGVPALTSHFNIHTPRENPPESLIFRFLFPNSAFIEIRKMCVKGPLKGEKAACLLNFCPLVLGLLSHFFPPATEDPLRREIVSPVPERQSRMGTAFRQFCSDEIIKKEAMASLVLREA